MSDDTLMVDAPREAQPAGDSLPADAVPETEPDELAYVRAERDEYLDMLQRLQAGFEDFRKQVRRDQGAMADRAAVGEEPAGESPSEG